jgi:hypothetical protein
MTEPQEPGEGQFRVNVELDIVAGDIEQVVPMNAAKTVMIEVLNRTEREITYHVMSPIEPKETAYILHFIAETILETEEPDAGDS